MIDFRGRGKRITVSMIEWLYSIGPKTLQLIMFHRRAGGYSTYHRECLDQTGMSIIEELIFYPLSAKVMVGNAVKESGF